MIEREAKDALLQLAQWYPIVAVVGPRQSGKTTLVKEIFSDYTYINLEDNDQRERALADPVGFVKLLKGNVIFDEIQNCPDLFSQLQVESDADEKPGRYIISGSRNLAMSKHIRQSLAGRVGILKLLSLSWSELSNSAAVNNIQEAQFRGGYPRLYNSRIREENFYRNYIETYVDKDVKTDLKETNLIDYKKTIQVCAQSSGNLVNYSNIAASIGVSRQTIKSWISLLIESFICFELPAYFTNKMKSLTKTPKLFFYDTGLLCNLLGITSVDMLLQSKHKGQIFENFVISETLKKYYNSDKLCNLYFYRDDSKREVDLIDGSRVEDLNLCEIKSTSTFNKKFLNNLATVSDMLDVPPNNCHLLMDTERKSCVNEMHVENLDAWLKGIEL